MCTISFMVRIFQQDLKLYYIICNGTFTYDVRLLGRKVGQAASDFTKLADQGRQIKNAQKHLTSEGNAPCTLNLFKKIIDPGFEIYIRLAYLQRGSHKSALRACSSHPFLTKRNFHYVRVAVHCKFFPHKKYGETPCRTGYPVTCM